MTSPYIHSTPYTGPIQAVVLDWAGTAVDFGCMGPAAVFIEAFHQFDINATIPQARQFMGLEKKDHIRAMLHVPEIETQWKAKKGETPGEAAVDAVYQITEPMMVAAIEKHCEPIDGMLDFVDALRRRDIKIGSSTGYTQPMMDILKPLAAQRGYKPDATVCASDVPQGRPYPWMCFLNAIQLETYPMEAMVKIGDTISDVEEGRNAGMWTVGLTLSGNEMGMTQDQAAALPEEERRQRLADIEARYKQCGAHFVAAGIWECLPLIDTINSRLAKGQRP
jgi:phosphonoacetaldehyde hydrolase